MSTTNNPEPDPPASAPEELVAYLDGELSPEECRQIEERLANDSEYRQQLRDLDQAWEALDSLPTTAVADNFARTTIEMVALVAKVEQGQRAAEMATTNRTKRIWWAAAAAAMAVASFVAARQFVPDSNSQLLADLPVIWQLNLLDEVQDVAFLRKLSQEVPVDKMASDAIAVQREWEQHRTIAAQSPAERREWLESLPPEKKANLATHAREFESAPPIERRRLQDLAREISAAADAEQLRTSMSAYGQWLARQSEADKSHFRGLSSDEKIRSIRETIDWEDQQAARRLSPADARELRQEIGEIYVEQKDEFLKAMRRRDERHRPRRLDLDDSEMALIVATWALRNLDIDDKTRKRIVRDLTPAAQEHLERLWRSGGAGRGGEGRVKFQLWKWMRDAMNPKREPGEMERFFAEELTNSQRERLLSLPKDQMEAELERMFLGAQFGIQDADWLGRFDRPRRPPGENPDGAGQANPPRGDGREGDRPERDGDRALDREPSG